MPRSPVTLVGRVARTTTLAVALGASLTAATASVIANRIDLANEDAHLRDTITMFAMEMHARPAIPTAVVAEDEIAELGPTGLHLAWFDGATRLAGDPDATRGDVPGCDTVVTRGVRTRRCTVALAHGTAVVTAPLGPYDLHARVLALAGMCAVVVAALVAALASRPVAALAVQPLTRLRTAVAAVSPDEPRAAWDASHTGCAEVDDVRDALTVLLDRLDASLSQARRFAADAAHELRTPLATLSAELELLCEGGDPAPVTALERQQRTLRGMTALVERLLILAMPGERAADARTVVAVGDVVNESVEALAPARRTRVTRLVECDGAIAGDATLVRSLVDNAIDNALKFSGDAPVRVRVGEHDGSVVLTVSDEGPGIARGEREQVFRAFYRTADARASTTRGHGVGLALIAHVIAAHGGTVHFADVARGAQLVVRFPAWRDASVQRAGATRTGDGSHGDGTTA